MATLGYQAVADLAYEAGFRGTALAIAVAVAKAESNFDPRASNRNRDGSIDRGLWQINSVHGGGDELYDPDTNADYAFRVYQRAGNSFSPWVAYKLLRHLPYMVPASVAARQAMQSQGAPKGTDSGVGAWAKGAVTDPGQALADAGDWYGGKLGFLAVLFDPKTWIRVLLVIIGAVLALFALALFSKELGGKKVAPTV